MSKLKEHFNSKDVDYLDTLLNNYEEKIAYKITRFLEVSIINFKKTRGIEDKSFRLKCIDLILQERYKTLNELVKLHNLSSEVIRNIKDLLTIFFRQHHPNSKHYIK